MFRRVISTAIAVVALAMLGQIKADVVEFEGWAPPGGSACTVGGCDVPLPSPYVECGWEYRELIQDDFFIVSATFPLFSEFTNPTGDFGFTQNDSTTLEIRQENGEVFDLTSFDAATMRPNLPAVDLTLTGFLSGGGSVTLNVVAPNVGDNGGAMQTFDLTGLGFTGLTSVQIVRTSSNFTGFDNFHLNAIGGCSSVVTPSTVTPTLGQYVGGGIAELAESDNADYQMRRSNNDLQSRTEFEVKSTSPTATPTRFEFTLKGSVFARGNVVQTIEFFDYVAGDWELVDTTNAARAPMPDKVVTATATGDLSRFVEAGTLCIAARIRYKSDRNRQKFASNTDQAIWMIVP